MALPNPASQLSTIISQLYDLAGNSTVPPDQQQALLLKAHDLRGDLIGLVAVQFANNTAAYQNVMTSLTTVSNALDQAQRDITKTIGVVNGVGQLASSIDDLLKEAASLGAL